MFAKALHRVSCTSIWNHRCVISNFIWASLFSWNESEIEEGEWCNTSGLRDPGKVRIIKHYWIQIHKTWVSDLVLCFLFLWKTWQSVHLRAHFVENALFRFREQLWERSNCIQCKHFMEPKLRLYTEFTTGRRGL